jgi:hypothetical protein
MTDSQLTNYSLEVSYGAQWINLNDHERFVIHADTTPNRAKTYRQVKATSQVVEGDVLLHSVQDMVVETVKVLVYGQDHVDMEDNLLLVETLFEQFKFEVRQTKNEYREIWLCQAATTMTIETGQVYLHNQMAVIAAQIPRYPTVDRERIVS